MRIADGAARAAVPVLVAGLRAVGVEAEVVEAEVLDRLGRSPVLGGGVPVGEVRPVEALLRG